jgi:hypothetical protein
MSKHVELWAMNVFNEWRLFCGFDTTKFIIDLLEDEGSIKDLEDMMSYFVLYIEEKKMVVYIFQPSTILYHY